MRSENKQTKIKPLTKTQKAKQRKQAKELRNQMGRSHHQHEVHQNPPKLRWAFQKTEEP